MMDEPRPGSQSRRWVRRPEGSNWGDFGPDDRIGRLNLLTPARIRSAMREVENGLRFCLSLPLDHPGGNVANPRRHPPRLFACVDRDERPVYNQIRHRADGSPTGAICDDAVLLYTQYSTQWDGFAHFGAIFDADGDGVSELVYYNGWRSGASVRTPDPNEAAPSWARYEGATAGELGIDQMARAAIQGRGVLVDLHSRYGRSHHAVTYDDLMFILDEDSVTVEPGDIVCFYTGYDSLILEMAGRPTAEALHRSCPALDGGDERLLRWITDTNLAAIASDNRAIEMLPSPDPGRSPYDAPLHAHCLFKLGVPMGEMWYLAELAAWLKLNHRSRFLLTAPPLRLPGAVGSPVTPIATV